MIDWGAAERLATLAGGDPPAGVPPVDLAAVRDDAVARVTGLAQLDADGALPPLEWVSRAEWVRANIASMRATLEPALAQIPPGPAPLRAVSGAVLGAELGGLLALFSRRVMGQYDLRLVGDPVAPRLLLVAPNLRGAAAQLGVPEDDFVTWVAVHEVCHAVQFEGVPWLRDHLGDAVGALLSDLRAAPALDALRGLDPRALANAVRERGIVGVALGPERAATLDRIQATMSLVEGHAEWVMDTAGGEAVADVGALRGALERRRAGRHPLLKVLDRLLGFELKLRQYEQGKRFCDAVAAAGGPAAVRRAWDGPESLPTPAELDAPEAWMARVAPVTA